MILFDLRSKSIASWTVLYWGNFERLRRMRERATLANGRSASLGVEGCRRCLGWCRRVSAIWYVWDQA